MNTPDSFFEVSSWIREQIAERSLPSLAVAVVQAGQIVWEEGFGWADRERRIPSDAHTPYSLASVSKPITTTALMVLKERGLIDLDGPVNEYLGAAKLTAHIGESKDATVRRVASHTAGLPLHWQFFYDDEPARPPSVDETILRYANLVSAPGERYRYSNIGYGILDYVISRVSGKSYAEFLREELFLPLGMVRSSVDIGVGLEEYAAARYTPEGMRLPFYTFDHPGASAVYSSAHDLARFALLHLKQPLADQKQILQQASLDEMQIAVTPPDSNYGLGWVITEDVAGRWGVSHGGGMPGVSTELFLIPSEGLAVITLVNTNTDLHVETRRRILGLLLPGYTEWWEAKQVESDAAAKPESPFPAELSGKWSGIIRTPVGERKLELVVDASGDIRARVGDGFRVALEEGQFEEGWLTGDFLGNLDTADVNRAFYLLSLDLKLREDRLTGAVIASSRPGGIGRADTGRGAFGLSYWTELQRQG